MGRKKAVLFDLDGTLINSLPDISHSMNQALRMHGLPTHPLDAYRYFVGDGAVNLTRRAIGPEHQALTDAVLRDYSAIYAAHCNDTSHVYAGIPQMLDALRAAGLRMAVLSNKDDGDVARVIGHYFADHPFDLLRGRRPGVPIKPDPTAALQIADDLNLTPDDFWYLGDTPTDIAACQNAGMHLIAVSWGFRPESELIAAGAKRVARTPEEALDIMLNE